jgi:hypothetical protein
MNVNEWYDSSEPGSDQLYELSMQEEGVWVLKLPPTPNGRAHGRGARPFGDTASDRKSG